MFRFACLVALVALLAPVGTALADDTESLIIYTAFFERRSSTLSADDIKVLEMIVSLMARDDSYEMRIVAYTDPVDEDEDDKELAKARAKAVREFMTGKGVDKDRIETDAEGDEASFGRDDSDADRALRRRAEILVRQEDREKRAIDKDIKKGTDTALQTTVFFDFDKAEIKDEFRGVLKRLGEMLKGNPAYRVRVFGHTDGVGNARYNLALGNRRCEAVIGELQKLGVSEKSLERASLGQKETIGSQELSATTSRALSRSVEIKVMKAEDDGKETKEKKEKK